MKESEAGLCCGCPLGELDIADTMPACRSALISPSLSSSRRDLPIEDALGRVLQDKEGPKGISSSMVGWWRCFLQAWCWFNCSVSIEVEGRHALSTESRQEKSTAKIFYIFD